MQLLGPTKTYNQQALTFDPVYLHVSSSHSCWQAAASVVTGKSEWKPNRKWHHVRCSVISLGWVGENDRVKGRKKTQRSATDGWKEEAVCVSFSFSGCGSDVPDSVVLFKASQTNKLILFKSLIYLIRGATNTHTSSPALPSDDCL